MGKNSGKRKSRWGLFLPITLFAVLVVAYSAYWIVARGVLEDNIDTWIDGERAGGSVVEFSSKRMSGYPFLFELTIEDPIYQIDDTARWEGKVLTLSMQPWNWNHVIVRSPGLNRVTDRAGVRHTVDLDDKSAGSVSWDKTSVRRVGLMINDAPALVDGAAMHLKGFSLNLSPRSESPDDLMIAVQWDEIALQEAPLFAPWLGADLGQSRMVGEVRGFFPALRVAGGNTNRLQGALIRQGGELEVAQLLLDWGPLDLGLKMDAKFIEGAANGSVGVRLDNVDDLRAALEADGSYDLPTKAALSVLESGSADGKFFTLPIKDNGVYIMGQRVAELPAGGM